MSFAKLRDGSKRVKKKLKQFRRRVKMERKIEN
jgi:hypothetical protein